jgi:undecaprenyl-diphosphatase
VALDQALLTIVVQHRLAWLDDVMVFISWIGNLGGVWVALAVVGFFFAERRPAAFRLWLTMLCVFLVVELGLKSVVARARPFDVVTGLTLLSVPPLSSSFPSTHAALGFAGALAGVRVFAGAGWWLWPLAVLVASSRVYLGVHWPSDVVFGSVMGCACAWLVLGGDTTSRTHFMLSVREK